MIKIAIYDNENFIASQIERQVIARYNKLDIRCQDILVTNTELVG